MIKRTRRLVIVNVSLALLLVIAAAGGYLLLFRDDGDAGASDLRTVAVARGTVEATVSATGTVGPARSANVDFATSGTVEKVRVQVGDEVRKGDVLARLDDTAAQQALTAAESKLTAAQEARAELDDSDHEPSDSQVAAAQANVDTAEAEVSQAQADVDATKLTAPMSGTVLAVNGTAGSSASGGGSSDTGDTGDSGDTGDAGDSGSSGDLDLESGFVVLGDLDHLVVDAAFAEADTAKLKAKQRATLTFPALPDTEATGKVGSIGLTGTNEDGVTRYDVRVGLTRSPKILKVGQTATISVVTQRATDVLYVPTIAVQGSGDQASVDVLRDGRSVPTSVTTGVQGDTFIEISSGLSEGDKVVLADASDGTSQQTGEGGPGTGRMERGSKPNVVQKP